MNLDINQNHFKLFGLTEGFALHQDELDRVYRRLQAEVHPDRFTHASENERRMSMQWAMHVNEAYQTLKKPLKRAGYLLSLHGIDPKIETNTSMPHDFLAAQMEWREAIEEANEAHDGAALDRIEARLKAEMGKLYREAETELDDRHDYAAAATTFRKLMFLEKLGEEVHYAITELDD
jgi:molecular chaperone HscB